MKITELQRQETEAVLDRLMILADISRLSQRERQLVSRVAGLYREKVGEPKVRADEGVTRKVVQADIELDHGA